MSQNNNQGNKKDNPKPNNQGQGSSQNGAKPNPGTNQGKKGGNKHGKKSNQPNQGSGGSANTNQQNASGSGKQGSDNGESPAQNPMKRGLDNDFEWYNSDPDLIQAAAGLTFGTVVGLSSHLNLGEHVIEGTNFEDFDVPTVMTIYCASSVGYTNQFDDPINIVSRKMLTSMRVKYSSQPPYEAPDLAIYLACIHDAIAYLGYLRRVYKVLNVYDTSTRGTPDDLLRSMYVDPTSAKRDVMKLLAGIIQLTNQLSIFSVPKLKYFEKAAWMYSNVYKDTDSRKTQYYLYNPAVFLMYSPVGSPALPGPTGTVGAVPVAFNGDFLFSVDDLLNFGQNLLSPMMEDTVFGAISHDIGKFYEQDLFGFTPITIGEQLEYGVSDEVKEQFANAMIMDYNLWNKAIGADKATWSDPDVGGTLNTLKSFGIYDSTKGYVVHHPTISLGYHGTEAYNSTLATVLGYTPGVMIKDHLLNLHEAASAENVTTASQMVYNASIKREPLDSEPNMRVLLDGGDFIPIWGQVIYHQGKAHIYATTTKSSSGWLKASRTFHFAPTIYDITIDSGKWWDYAKSGAADIAIHYDTYGEFDNYGLLTPERVKQIHRVCFYSLLGLTTK